MIKTVKNDQTKPNWLAVCDHNGGVVNRTFHSQEQLLEFAKHNDQNGCRFYRVSEQVQVQTCIVSTPKPKEPTR